MHGFADPMAHQGPDQSAGDICIRVVARASSADVMGRIVVANEAVREMQDRAQPGGSQECRLSGAKRVEEGPERALVATMPMPTRMSANQSLRLEADCPVAAPKWPSEFFLVGYPVKLCPSQSIILPRNHEGCSRSPARCETAASNVCEQPPPELQSKATSSNGPVRMD